MHNLLTESLIRYDNLAGNRVEASLPEVYEALMSDSISAFPALRPHQRHAWHAFLVQLGVMAVYGAGMDETPSKAADWAGLIRGLTSDFPDDEPWHLVVEDITKPAFMQPPARAQERAEEYKNPVYTPDEVDMLVTSKDHDLKSAVAERAGMDDWVFALITLQTMEGFGGAGNYGISRMNGGLGNRPAFAMAPAHGGIGAHVRRDIIALLERRPEILERNAHYLEVDGIALLWTLPWDGTTGEALRLDSLDPFYIEICRRLRLRMDEDGNVHGIRTTSKAARIDAKSLNGVTGDPWAPTDFRDKKGAKVLTLPAGGFHYRRVKDYLTSGDYGSPELLRPTTVEAQSGDNMKLVARAMVRGQGKTEGYHERVVLIRSKLKSAILRRTADDDLAAMAQRRVENVATVQRILSHAIQVFAARGEPDRVNAEHRALARPWLDRLDAMVDERFFEALQDEFEADDDDSRKSVRDSWLRDGVVEPARELLLDATESLPCPAIHRYKAQVNAQGLFEGRLRGNSGLPSLFEQDMMEAKG